MPTPARPRPRASAPRPRRRLLSLLLTALLVAVGLVTPVGAAAPARAATASVETGAIRAEGAGVDRIYLDANMRSQLWAPVSTEYGAYYRTAEDGRDDPARTASNTGPVVVLRSGAVFSLQVSGASGGLVGQDHGGSGTHEDPYWIATTREVAGVMRVVKTDLYVTGAGYTQSRLSYTNLGPDVEDAQLGYWYDCYFASNDWGRVALTDASVSCVAASAADGAMELMAASPGAERVAGAYYQVRDAMHRYGVTSGCWGVNGPTECASYSGDNGFAIGWRAADVAPGETVERIWFTRFDEDVDAVADLVVDAQASAAEVLRGEELTYTVTVRNDGPFPAEGVAVQFPLPPGMTYRGQSGSGAYVAATGTWDVGDLGHGETATTTIRVRAAAVGTWDARVEAASAATTLDPTACTDGSPDSCGSTTSVLVEAGFDAASSVLTADPPVVAADGTATSTLTLRAAGADGQPAGVGGLDVRFDATLGTVGGLEDHGDGTYTAALTSTVAGPSEVAALAAGETVAGPTVTFVAGDPDVGHEETALTVTDRDAVADGVDTQTATVVVVDRFGNPVPGAPVVLGLDAALGASSPVAGATGADGTFTVDLTSVTPGAHPVTATVDGVAVQHGSPAVARFRAGAVDPGHDATALRVSGRDAVADGAATQTVTVTAADAQGNPVAGAAVEVDLADPLAAAGPTAGVTGADGAFEVDVTSTVAGAHEVTATVDGAAVRHGSPAVAVFRAGEVDLAHERTALSAGTHEQPADGVAAHTVRVSVVDAAGNPVAGAPVEIQPAPELSAASPLAGVTDGAGAFTADLTSTTAGRHEVTATVGGVTVVHGSPAGLRFRAGDVDPDHVGTVLAVTTRDAVADGRDTQTVTVSAADRFGNPVPGVPVALDLAAPLVAVDEPDPTGTATGDPSDGAGRRDGAEPRDGAQRVTGADGTVEVDVATTVAGAHEVAATVAGAPVAHGSPAVAVFRAGPPVVDPGPQGAASSYAVTDDRRPVGEEHEVDVRLVDAHGNPVDGAAGLLAGSSPDGLGDGEVTAFRETGPGEYRAAVRSTEGGDKRVVVELDGEPLRPGDGANTVARYDGPEGGADALARTGLAAGAAGVLGAVALVAGLVLAAVRRRARATRPAS